MKTRIFSLLATLTAILAIPAAAQCTCGCGGGGSACGCGPTCGPRVYTNSEARSSAIAPASARATAATPKAVPADYPLATCVVSGKKLGTSGAPYVFTYKQHTVALCSRQYLPAFLKDPAKYIATLDAAAQKTNAQQIASN